MFVYPTADIIRHFIQRSTVRTTGGEVVVDFQQLSHLLGADPYKQIQLIVEGNMQSMLLPAGEAVYIRAKDVRTWLSTVQMIHIAPSVRPHLEMFLRENKNGVSKDVQAQV